MSELSQLQNEILLLESQSDRYVPYDKYYALEVSFPREIPIETIQNIGKKYVVDTDNQPLFTYSYGHKVLLFFSSLYEGKHYLSGSHQRLCSEYAAKTSKNLESDLSTTCKLVEFESRNRVYTYLIWKNVEAHFGCIAHRLGISFSESFKKTLQESKDLLKESGIDVEQIPKFEKFGAIYRLREKKGKVSVCSLSTFLDSRKKNKHMEYLFG